MGVFVNCDEGLVSFYDVKARSPSRCLLVIVQKKHPVTELFIHLGKIYSEKSLRACVSRILKDRLQSE